jgi:class 3 adenylate cyclase
MVSLRLTISVWMAVAVILVAAITLSITLSSSLIALRAIGAAHAKSLLANANQETTHLFGTTATQIDLMRNLSRSRNWTWPSQDATTNTYWDAAVRTTFLSGEGRVNGLGLVFGDGTVIAYSVNPSGDNYTSTNYLPAPISDSSGFVNLTWDTYSSATHELLKTTMTSMNEKELNDTYVNVVRAVPAGVDMYYYLPTFTAYLWNGDLNIMFTGLSVLPRHKSQRFQATFGMIISGLTVSTLSKFLAAAQQTPNTAAFAITSDGYIVGAAAPGMTQVPYTSRPLVAGRAVPAGCANVTVVGASPGTMPSTMACLLKRGDISFAPLRELSDDVTTSKNDVVHQLKLGGRQYFVAVARVPIRITGLIVQLILLMPEKDIIGDVVKSQNIAIGVSAAVVVVMAAASFAFIVAMLRPLDDVAERMLRAATFEPETEPLSMSAMQEVRDLQTAYKQMSAELNRIRSFVPQSVLQGGGGEASDDGEGSLIESLDQSRMSVEVAAEHTSDSRSHHSSRRHSRSPRSVVSHSYVLRDRNAVALDCSVRPQIVSVLVANVECFERYSQSKTRDEVVVIMASLVDRVVSEVRTRGGVLAFFHGDHFAATFNAVKPCGIHARQAAFAATHLTRPLAGELPLRAGVSTGKCLVGNVGSADSKNFSVMGPAFTQALVLERLTRLYTTGEGAAVAALASRRTCEDIATNYLYEYVDLVQLPGSAQATLVGRLVGPKANGAANQHDTEWLYVVGEGKANDPYAAANAAMVEVASGKLEGVATYLDSTRSVASTNERPAPSALRVLEGIVNTGAALPSALGSYYAAAHLHRGTSR